MKRYLFILAIGLVACSKPKTPEVTASTPEPVPYGAAVPNKPGFVTSPYSPTNGYVDVRGFPKDTEVKDPYSGKIFRVP